MGANMSGSVLDEDDPLRPRLGDIPESCVALVLYNLDPPEICNLARLNRSFRSASSADFIWESKLPPNYKLIVEKVLDDTSVMEQPKKTIYARLCSPNTFDHGTKEIWLDKGTGGLCVLISSKALKITGIDDRRYWNHIPTEESRFTSVAYLQQIWWFEVVGEFEFPFPEGTYSLFFRLHLGRSFKRLGRRVCYSEHIHGWDIKPVKFQLRTSEGHQSVSKCYLSNPGKWVFYHVGNFVIEKHNSLSKVQFSMTQIDCTHTKGGICVDSVFICNSEVAKGFSLLL